MKYLYSINEMLYSKSEISELQNYCETHLIELIDDGFVISIEEKSHFINIILHKYGIGFRWNYIKDDFLSFFEMIQSDYSLDYQIRNGITKHITINNTEYLHKDEISISRGHVGYMSSISFSIKQKSYI